MSAESKSEKLSKNKFKRDFIVLSVSFTFTIVVAGFILIHTQSERLQSEEEIIKLIQKIVEEKIESIPKFNNFYERENNQLDDDDERTRSKRAIHEFRITSTDGPIVEFFDPKLRPELEKNDSMIMKKNSWKGAAPKGDSWVWLTAYSRIPFEAIDGFCKQTKEYCPPGPSGLPGVAGQKGTKGEVGPIGPPGWSIKGPKGDRGTKGFKGNPGTRGLDGVDGRPGEPGLDGSAGRHGVDGTPGKNGSPGKDGIDGEHGKHGERGLQGPRGYPGPTGEKGFDGPRGPKGDAGINGLNGSPGTCLHSCSGFNTVESIRTDILFFNLPPRIPAASNNSNVSPTISVMERDNLRLRCSAEGHPKPKVLWRRKDGQPIAVSEILSVNAVDGNVLNFTSINRVHMGVYECVANNGIPSEATHEFPVEVHFKPMVIIDHRSEQQKMAVEGGTITLVCGSEASPYPVMYWERKDSTTIGSVHKKYKVVQYIIDSFKYGSNLTFFNISKNDIDKDYFCVSKNIIGMARVRFTLSSTGVNIGYTDNSRLIEGTPRPNITDYEQMCPMHPPCKECASAKDMKCKDVIFSLNDLIDPQGAKNIILPSFNRTYKRLPNRTAECELGLIGKPVFYHAIESEKFGAWLRDPVKVDNNTVEKVWLTKESDKKNLFEYRNRLEYQMSTKGQDPKITVTKYKLPCAFEGNAHIILNNAFYYYCKDGMIVRFDLKAQASINITVKDIGVNTTHKLYTTKYNVIDFNADDNGLWLIHSSNNSNYTIVTKINETTLEVQNSFNISVFHDKLGEMFIACGILYGVDSTTVRTTKIRLALDLYTKKVLDVDINFSNPFNNTSTVGYNFLTKDLYTWSMGNQLTYPVKINALGTNQTAEPSMEELVAASVSYSITRKNSP